MSKREQEITKVRSINFVEIIQHLYEFNIENKISDERFKKMIKTYEAEQNVLNNRIEELNKYINESKEKIADI